MVFSVEDRILIKVLKKEKGYGAKRLVREFPGKLWTLSGLSYLIEEWEHFHQVVIDEAVRQWQPRLRACIRAHGGHFEHRL